MMSEDHQESDPLVGTGRDTDVSSTGKKMAVSSAIVTALLFVSKMAGYVKEMLISRWLPQEATDGYKVVYNSVFNLIYTRTEELLRPTYFPIFVQRKLRDGDRKAWDLTNVLVTVELLFLIFVAGLSCLAAGPIIALGWPEVARRPDSFRVAVWSLRIMSPFLILYCMSLMTELTSHAYKRFTWPAMAEVAFRLSVVMVMVGLFLTIWPQGSPYAPFALAVSASVGGSLRFLLMIPALRKQLHLYRPSLNFRHPDLMAMLKLMPWVVFGVIFSVLRTWADSRMGTAAGVGSYSCLDWARRLIDLPVQVLAIAVSFVVYPYLSEWATTRNKDKMIKALAVTTRAIAFIYVPTAILMMILSLPISWLVYGGGEFKMEDALMTARAIDVYSAGIPFLAMESIIMKWFFALQDTATPNLVGAGAAVLHVLIAVFGVKLLKSGMAKTGAVALALTVSKTTKVVILYVFLKKKLGRISDESTRSFFLKLLVCGSVMVLGVWGAKVGLSTGLGLNVEDKKQALVLVMGGSMAGLSAFLFSAFLLRIEELRMVISEAWLRMEKVSHLRSRMRG